MKLHPLSIPFRIVSVLWNLIGGAFFLGFVLLQFVSFQQAILLGGALLVVLIVGGIIWQVAYYRRYEFAPTEDTFDIDSGVFSRREREIPYGRIQNVAINQNVVQRVLGIAELNIETAGGSSTEAQLQYVGIDTAQNLQDELSRRKQQADAARTVTESERTEQTEETIEKLFELNPHELAILGVISIDSRLFFVALFALSTIGPGLQGVIGASIQSLFTIPLTLVGLYVVTALFGAVYAVTSYYGFKLFEGTDELRYERGLLQRHSGTIPLGKIQSLTLSENVLARRLGYASVSVETAGFSPGETSGSQTAVPIAARDRAFDLARRIENFESPSFTRPPKRARERYAARYGLVVVAILGLGYLINWATATAYPWYYLGVVILLVPIAAHLKWRHRGYVLTDDHVITRNGFWTRSIAVVPYRRVQTVIDSRTVFQRRRRLATLTIDTAGSGSLLSNNSKAVDIDAAVADDLREEILDRALAATGQSSGTDSLLSGDEQDSVTPANSAGSDRRDPSM